MQLMKRMDLKSATPIIEVAAERVVVSPGGEVDQQALVRHRTVITGVIDCASGNTHVSKCNVGQVDGRCIGRIDLEARSCIQHH